MRHGWKELVLCAVSRGVLKDPQGLLGFGFLSVRDHAQRARGKRLSPYWLLLSSPRACGVGGFLLCRRFHAPVPVSF